MDILFKLIKENTKSNYRAVYDENHKLFNNVANYGGNISTKAMVGRKGEYYGLTVEFLSNVKPLITDDKIIRSLDAIDKENIYMAVIILNIEEEYQEYGIDIIYYTIEKWFLINNIDKSNLSSVRNFNSYDETKIKPNNNVMIRLKTQRHDPINCPIKIIGLGSSVKGNPVVPEDWLGREFRNGEELHREIDKLDWRKDKPPVSFCCIYSMSVLTENKWLNKQDIKKYNIVTDNLIMIMCTIENGRIKTNIYTEGCSWHTHENIYNYINEHNQTMKYYYNEKKKLLICMEPSIFKIKPSYQKEYSAPVLMSRLQKSFRRGSESSKILYDTVEQLNNAPYYNIPDQHFAKVSGTRQLLWRSYISIIEDVCGYYHKNVYDLQDFLVLSLICHINPELQIESKYIDQIKESLLNIQNINYAWPWRSGVEVPSKKFKSYGLTCDNGKQTRLIDSMIVALKYMPMMQGDRIMLSKCINYICENQYNMNRIKYANAEYYLKMSKMNIEKEVLLSANDMHCYPNIILLLQSSIPFLPTEEYNTHNLSKFIWENSSKYNMRYSKDQILNLKDKQVMESLYSIQKKYIEKINIDEINNIKYESNSYNNIQKTEKYIPKEISRLGFLIIFGQKIKLPNEGKNKPSVEIIVSGTITQPCKIKKYNNNDKYNYMVGSERFENEKRYVKFIEKGITIDLPPPPLHYRWNLNKKVKISASIEESDINNNINNINFYVNGIKIKPFDSSIFLEPIGTYEEIEIKDENLINIIENALYMRNNIGGPNLNALMRNIGMIRNNINDERVFSMKSYKNNNILSEVWRQLYSKIIMSSIVEIGPVDRSGSKTINSISYKYEGVYLRILNLLFMLYPKAIILKNEMKFEMNLKNPSFYNMIEFIKSCGFIKINEDNKNDKITIKTELWDHQKKTSERIYDGMINDKKRGYGDASRMGAGKTLTMLNLMYKLHLYNHNSKLKNHKGFLIMVPTVQLYKTWEDEINKHTTGYDIVFQNANGSLTRGPSESRDSELTKKNINTNTIVISTMGRTREHPLAIPWILVVIDECLTVQNKEALQTEEAIRQANASQYGIVLMSASFFKSRFDKLYFMLKLLRTGIPETTEYLDTILSESMVCNITNEERKWVTNITKNKLTDVQRTEYNEIIKKYNEGNYEKTYTMLNKYIHNNCDYIKYFKDRIEEIEKQRPNTKILIFAKSKLEGDNISNKCKNVSRYPDISKKHVVASVMEATYGLNNLIMCDTILMRPPSPDQLPQMKGRLDRHGQKNKLLYLEYILIENTIEEALLTRLELANNFYNSHIMPLADFYKIAVRGTIKLAM